MESAMLQCPNQRDCVEASAQRWAMTRTDFGYNEVYLSTAYDEEA